MTSMVLYGTPTDTAVYSDCTQLTTVYAAIAEPCAYTQSRKSIDTVNAHGGVLSLAPARSLPSDMASGVRSA